MHRKKRSIMKGILSYVLAFVLVFANAGTALASEEAHPETEIINLLESAVEEAVQEEITQAESIEDSSETEKGKEETETSVPETLAMNDVKAEETGGSSKTEDIAQEATAQEATAQEAEENAAENTTDVFNNVPAVNSRNLGLANGTYSIDAKIVSTTGGTSMAGGALESAYMKVDNGVITLYLNMQSVSGGYITKITYNSIDASEVSTDANGNVTCFSMPIEEGNSTYTVSFSIDLMPNVSPSANIVLDWDSVEVISLDEDNTGGDDDNNNADNGLSTTAKLLSSTGSESFAGVIESVNVEETEAGTKVKLNMQVIDYSMAGGSYKLYLNELTIEGVEVTTETDADGIPTAFSFTLDKNYSEINVSVGYSVPDYGDSGWTHAGLSRTLVIDWESAGLTTYTEPADESVSTTAKLLSSTGSESFAGVIESVNVEETAEGTKVKLNMQVIDYSMAGGSYKLYLNQLAIEGVEVTTETDADGIPTAFSFTLDKNYSEINVSVGYSVPDYGDSGWTHAGLSRILVIDWESAGLTTYTEPADESVSTTAKLLSSTGSESFPGVIESVNVEETEAGTKVKLNMQVIDYSMAGGSYKLYLNQLAIEGVEVTTETDADGIPTAFSFTLDKNYPEINVTVGYSVPDYGDSGWTHAGLSRILVIDWESAGLTTYTEPADESVSTTAKLLSSTGSESFAGVIESVNVEETETGTKVKLNMQVIDYSMAGVSYKLYISQLEIEGVEVTTETDADGIPTAFSFTLDKNYSEINVSVGYSVPDYGDSGWVHTGLSRILVIDWESAGLTPYTETVDDNNNDNNNDDNNGKDDNNDNNSGSDEDENQTDYDLEDGTYFIDATILNASKDELSMADEALVQAYIIAKSGKYTLYLEMQSISGVYLEKLEYSTDSGTYVAATAAEVDSDGNITAFSLPITYEASIVAVQFTFNMGIEMTQPARISLDWSTLKLSEEELTVPEETDPKENETDETETETNTEEETSTGDGTLDKTNLADGIYEVQVNLWHSTNNQASMANPAINKIARIVVSNGTYKMYIYTKTMTVGSITANLQRMQVENTSGGYSQAAVVASSNGNPTAFSFTMPHTNEYIAVRVDPQVEIMGNDYIDARLKISWSTLKKVSSSTSLTSSPDDSSVTAVKTGDFTQIRVWLLMLILSAGVMMYYLKKKNVYRKAAK